MQGSAIVGKHLRIFKNTVLDWRISGNFYVIEEYSVFCGELLKTKRTFSCFNEILREKKILSVHGFILRMHYNTKQTK